MADSIFESIQSRRQLLADQRKVEEQMAEEHARLDKIRVDALIKEELQEEYKRIRYSALSVDRYDFVKCKWHVTIKPGAYASLHLKIGTLQMVLTDLNEKSTNKLGVLNPTMTLEATNSAVVEVGWVNR